jgi:hypothetical protein
VAPKRVSAAEAILHEYQGYNDDFTPDLAVDVIRHELNEEDLRLHIMCDLVEGLWDEVLILRRRLSALDQSKTTPLKIRKRKE